MSPIRLRHVLLWLALAGTGGLHSAVQAQTELAQERASLGGVNGFYVEVDVEAGLALAGEEALDVVTLKTAVVRRLKAAGLPVTEEVAPPPALPQLYVHVNASDAGRGLVPFTVRLEFYQAVRLVRAPAQPIRASTWRLDLVGLVTQDQLSGVEEGMLGLTEAFIADFRGGNP